MTTGDMTAEMLAVDLTGISPVLVISSPGNLELCGDRNLIKLAVPSSRAEVNLMSEAEAHRFLQKYSMDTGLRLAETARLILERYTTG